MTALRAKTLMWLLSAALLMGATVAQGGEDAPATPVALPRGCAMLMDTSDLASLERAVMFFSNAMIPSLGTPIGLDQAFRTIQGSGQMPSLINPLIQQFFDLPGVAMDAKRGISLALFIPAEGEGETGRDLSFAACLPVRSFAELLAGVKEGRREWSHISVHPELPSILVINKALYGPVPMYVAAGGNGVVVSSTLWGLSRGQRHWRTAPAGALGNASGFTIRVVMDFLQPGAEAGLVAMLEGPAGSMVDRLRRGGNAMIADFTLFGLLQAMRQAASLDLRLTVGPDGMVSAVSDLAPKPGGNLSVFLQDAANRSLSPRFWQAMPRTLSIALALAGGKGVKTMLMESVRDFRISMARSSGDSLSRRVNDILSGIEMMAAASSGDSSAGMTVDGSGLALFQAGQGAATVASRLGGNDRVAVRTLGDDVVVAIGLDAAKTADDAAARLAAAAPDQEPSLRPELREFMTSLDGKGILAFACYPAEMIRLILTYKAKETYYSDASLDENNPLDMFAASYLGSLVRNMERLQPSRFPLTIAAESPRPEMLRLRAGLSLKVMSEIMATYQQAILTFTPSGLVPGGGE